MASVSFDIDPAALVLVFVGFWSFSSPFSSQVLLFQGFFSFLHFPSVLSISIFESIARHCTEFECNCLEVNQLHSDHHGLRPG